MMPTIPVKPTAAVVVTCVIFPSPVVAYPGLARRYLTPRGF
jgi:hypothetical protein